jgi:hypothetical protein
MTAPLKTYWHLAARQRKPTRYEVASARLHYYVGRGFEVHLPATGWYQRYQEQSPLQVPDWEQFSDPRQTDYAAYVRLQHGQEAHVEGVLRSIEESAYDRQLPPAARALLDRVVVPLRYVFHGLQMIAAYVGQMAPASRITIAALLQAADESRRIQRIAYRMAQLQQLAPSFGAEGRARWEGDAAWQPLRELVERMLVTYDWGEAFTALNLCAKPLLDDLLMVQLPTVARGHQDYLLGQLFSSLARDCDWHGRWSAALVQVALQGRADNRGAFLGWIERWAPRAEQAASALATTLGPDGPALVDASRDRALAFRQQLDLAPTGKGQPAP